MKKIIILLAFCLSAGLFAEGQTSRLTPADIDSLSESIDIYLAVTRGERLLPELNSEEMARYNFVQELVSSERVSVEQLENSRPRVIGKSAAVARLIDLTRPASPYYWGTLFGLNNLSNGDFDIGSNSAIFGLRLGRNLAERSWFAETELVNYGVYSDSSITNPSSSITQLNDNEQAVTALGFGVARRWQSNVFLAYFAKLGVNYLQVRSSSSQTTIDSSAGDSATSDETSSSAFAPALGFGVEITEYNNYLIRFGLGYSSFSVSDSINVGGSSQDIGSSATTSLELSVNIPL